VPKWVPAGTHRLSYRLEWSPESNTFERRIERQWSGWTNINKDHIIDACFNEKYDPIILTSQYHYERTSVDGDCSCTLTCSYFFSAVDPEDRISILSPSAVWLAIY